MHLNFLLVIDFKKIDLYKFSRKFLQDRENYIEEYSRIQFKQEKYCDYVECKIVP